MQLLVPATSLHGTLRGSLYMYALIALHAAPISICGVISLPLLVQDHP